MSFAHLLLALLAADAGTLSSDTASAATAADAGVPGARHASSEAVVFVGAGDIALCSGSNDDATARLLDDIEGTVFTLGDNAYARGSAAEFERCYAPSWGRHKARTRPTPGNHDYYTPAAAEYFRYFGRAAGDPDKGYYSYALGSWRVLVLNSNCTEVKGGCGRGSPQERWLRAELRRHAHRCTVALWHHPRFSTGRHGSNPATAALYQALYEHGADVLLTGHDHHYERFAPMNPAGERDEKRGLRNFVVGTGGVDLRGFAAAALPTTEVRQWTTHGVLKLTLKSDSFDWQFVPVPGRSFEDTGSAKCH